MCGLDKIDDNGNLCQSCRSKCNIDRVYAVAERTGITKRLVGDYKYNSEYGSGCVIARLMARRLPVLSHDTVIVPVPTIERHKRQRGFDHMLLVARYLSKFCGLHVDGNIIYRVDNSVQHQLSGQERRVQASKSMAIRHNQLVPPHVLIIDDIWTTGATVSAMTALLRTNGAKFVTVAVAAVQPKNKIAHQ